MTERLGIRRRGRVAGGNWLGGGEKIPSDLGLQKPVDRQVGIERVDHPIAKEVRSRDWVIPNVAGRVGIAGDVEPVATPPLAVGGRGEQPIDHPREGVRGFVTLEGCDLLRRGRQAVEVERRSPQQRETVGPWRGGDSRGHMPRVDERVDRRAIPFGISHLGHRRPLDRLEGPVIGGDTARLVACIRNGRSHGRAGPNCAAVDPPLEDGDLVRRQPVFLVGRHPQILRRPPDGRNDQALRRRPGHDRRAEVAPFEELIAARKEEPAFVGIDVAGAALFDEERPDMQFEKLLTGRIGAPCRPDHAESTRESQGRQPCGR